MPIVSSVLAGDARERDGRRRVDERHTDHLGVEYLISSLVDAGTDATAAMLARVATLNAQITAAEIASNIADITANGSLATVTLRYSTASQNAAALRDAYQTATRTEAIMMGDYLASLTNAQLMAAFGWTLAQVQALRANRLAPAATAAATIRAAAGA